MMSINGRTIVLKISRKSDRKSFKFFQMMEFNFIRRISKARFQKFFEENKTFVLEQSSLVKDGHLEEFTKTIFDRFLNRFFNDFELATQSKELYPLDIAIRVPLIPLRIESIWPEVNQHTVWHMRKVHVVEKLFPMFLINKVHSFQL